jgi:hypothetical protein
MAAFKFLVSVLRLLPAPQSRWGEVKTPKKGGFMT